MDSRLYWIWLAQALGAGNAVAGPLLERFSDAAAVYAATSEALRQAGVSPRLLRRFDDHSLDEAREILNRLLSAGGWLLTPEDALYPLGFHGMADRPVALYCRGALPALDKYPSIALVGTRRATPNGCREAYALSAGLAAGGMAVISGGAVGIDAAAHAGALDAGGKTVAILGCPPDEEYPLENRMLRQRILAEGGALVSEYPPGLPYKCVFPVRNRLLVGFSLGVCLGETPIRSGARITARLARENGRDVYALPGSVSGHHNDGAHSEIRSGAQLVTKAGDILEEYTLLYPGMLQPEAANEAQRQAEKSAPIENTEQPKKTRQKRQKQPRKKREASTAEPLNKTTIEPVKPVALPEEASTAAKQVYGALTDTPQPVDLLAEATGLTVPALLAALTELEMFGCAANSAGQQYRRL